MNYPVFMEVLHGCQDLVDHHTCIFLGVNSSLQNAVKQLSPRYPVGVGVQKEKDRKDNKTELIMLLCWASQLSGPFTTLPTAEPVLEQQFFVRLTDALECSFRVPVSISGKPREFG